MFEQIAVIGLGYVGLPLSLQFARNGVTVLGIDIDPAKIDALTAGRTYIKHVLEGGIWEMVDRKKFVPTTHVNRVAECDAVIICVPTPLTKYREPDLSYVLDTGRAIAPHLRQGTLVVLESTTYPGTTDEDLRRVLEESAPFVVADRQRETTQVSGANEDSSTFRRSDLEPSDPRGRRMQAGRDFHLAFSPEREDPGNPASRVAEIPKVVGGLTPRCLEKAVELYSRCVETVVPVSSCRAAEATKLLENIFRSVNIALVNELKIIYAAMQIDIWEVIEAAKTKPFGFMPFYPGPGLGGHCIPIDPFYLTWKAREFGKHTRFIELAGEINTAMPEYVVQRLTEALNNQCKSVRGSKVLLVGLAYKANVDDMRESPTFVLMDLLSARGATVAYYDPHVPEIGPTREHREWKGVRSIDWNEEAIRLFDAAIIATAHAATNHEQLAKWCDCIVDTRNVFDTTDHAGVWKA
jgi:UDP-N-acetyl-D-glucosamine dehydrogenase